MRLSWFYDLCILRIYFVLKYRKRIAYENAGYILYNDGSLVYKTSFMNLCDKKGLDWVANMEYLHPDNFF